MDRHHRRSLLGALSNCLIALLAAGTGAGAQPMELVADLNPTEENRLPGGGGGDFRNFGAQVIFQSGRELWVTGGTSATTFRAAEPCNHCSSDPRPVAATEERFFWIREAERNTGARFWLWSTNGERRGARVVDEALDILPVNFATGFLAKDRDLYFGASRDGTPGVWRLSDRDSAPVLLNEGSSAGLASSRVEFAVLGNQVFFLQELPFGDEMALWKTDGTAGGTSVVREIGVDFRFAAELTAVGGRLFFYVRSFEGDDLWTSDGTAPGTRPVTRFDRGEGVAFRSLLVPWGDRILFQARTEALDTELWASDGTADGTGPLTRLEARSPFPSASDGVRKAVVAAVGESVAFFARDAGSGPLLLWGLDPEAPAGAVPLGREEVPSFDFSSATLVVAGDRFFATDGNRPSRLWVSDGTPEGTALASTFCGEDCSSEVRGLAEIDGEAFFVGSPQGVLWRGLWRSDGTAAGTRRILGGPDEPLVRPSGGGGEAWIVRLGDRLLLTARHQGYDSVPTLVGDGGDLEVLGPLDGFIPSSSPSDFVPWGDRLSFDAGAPGGGRSRWVVNADGSDLKRIALEHPWDLSFFLEHWEGADGLLFALANENRILRTDGTPQGTFDIWNREPSTQTRLQPRLAVGLGGALIFAVEVSGTGCQLWRTEGAVDDARLLFELPEPGCGFIFSEVRGAEAFFMASVFDGEQREGLALVTDGTEAGSHLVARIPGLPVDPNRWQDRGFLFLGDMAYLLLDGELWKIDTEARHARSVSELPCCASPARLVAFDGRVFLLTNDRGSSDIVLRVTDGTAPGTFEIARFPVSGNDRRVGLELAATEARLVFSAYRQETGFEPWQSDGTPEGTQLAGDLFPGATGSRPQGFVSAGGSVFFTASDPFHGSELWTVPSVGPPRRVQDLNPGPASGIVGEPFAFGEDVWVSGSDGLRGFEPWRLPGGGGAACRPGPERLCLQGGRFAVEAQWRSFQGRRGTGTAVPLSSDTGYFWFFDAGNVEAVIKVLDGRPRNDHFWTFYGALTNVEFFLTVTDTETSSTRRYFNPQRKFASVGDTRSFGPLGAGLQYQGTSSSTSTLGLPPRVTETHDPTAVGEGCVPSSTRLCLQESRFAVEARWTDFRGESGAGQAVALTGDTGYFWFFRETNVETVLKVLDGRQNNGNFWVFYGALSNVDYDLVVTDCETGAVKTYLNRGRTFASVGDTMAFPGS